MKKFTGFLTLLLVGFTLSACTANGEETSNSDTKESTTSSTVTSSSKAELLLQMDEEFQSDENGDVKILGTTLPDSKVKIGRGIIGDSTTADKTGKFELSSKIKDEEKEVTINVSNGDQTTSKKITLKPHPILLEESSEESNTSSTEESSSSSDCSETNEISQYIDQHLKDNQGWASGTIDENGNPIENGQPNPDYANWLYVQSIKYDGTNIDVQVTSDFQSLSDEEKADLASSSQGIVMSYADLTTRPHIYFYNGENSLGGSKVLSATDFKWK